MDIPTQVSSLLPRLCLHRGTRRFIGLVCGRVNSWCLSWLLFTAQTEPVTPFPPSLPADRSIPSKAHAPCYNVQERYLDLGCLDEPRAGMPDFSSRVLLLDISTQAWKDLKRRLCSANSAPSFRTWRICSTSLCSSSPSHLAIPIILSASRSQSNRLTRI